MYIKRLEIVGFKSFPDRTLVVLNPGISAVVGPNGCGKSNIIDAIRWVMGEQSPKILRGRNMDDILFNGSQGRPPSALAEVTLTLARDFDPRSGALSPAESAVTRRLYRSGDSEYLINKVPCRLKDVIHFFMDAGVGTRAYGIIEQGRVGWLVDARPEERRSLIDEAAGITRYKQQKREAERKIEAAEQNILNIAVIRNETKKQLDQAARAAAKAARYQALKKELRDLDLAISARRLTADWNRRKEINEHLAENQKLLAALIAEASRLELEAGALELERLQAEQLLNERTAAWHALNTEFEGLKKDIEFTEQNLSGAQSRRGQALADLEGLKSERRRKLEEEASLTEALEGLMAADREAQRHRDELREKWRSRKSASETLNQERIQAGRQLSEVQKELARLAESLAGQESLLSHHRQRQTFLGRDARKAEETADRAFNQLDEKRTQIEKLRLQTQEARETAVLQKEELVILEARVRELEGELHRAEASLGALRARLETLAGVKADFGWYPQGVQALMENYRLKDHGLIGPLAEHLQVPDGYEDAVEAALGERLAWILVENRAVGLAALDHLKREGLGRCGFIVQEDLAGGDLTSALLGPLELAETITGREDISAGRALLTREGDYWGAGLLAGGRKKDGDDQDTGLLVRLKELEQLESEERRADQAVEAVRSSLDEARQARTYAVEVLAATESRWQVLEKRLIETEKDLLLAASEEKNAAAVLSAIQHEVEANSQTVYELETGLSDGLARKESLAESLVAAETAHRALSERSAEAQEALEDLRDTGQEAALTAGRAAELLDRARHDLARVSEWLGEVEERLAAKEEESRRLVAEIESHTAYRSDLAGQRQVFPERLAVLEKNAAAARTEVETGRQKISAKEQETRNARRRREALNEITNNQSNDLLALNFGLEKIEEDLLREWRVVMAEPKAPQETGLTSKAETEAAATGETAGLAADLPEEPPAADASASELAGDGNMPQLPAAQPPERLDPRDWAGRELPAEAEERRDRLRTQVNALGPVSLESLEQETVLAQEYQRYQTQFEDLTRAVADLKDSIGRINHTCRVRFSETFAAVDAKFREIFPILFEGGEGWLSLTDGNDSLESGVEIHVHPPGKKITVMSLLSGGEKALTALALIFALYLIKPSPFCLLDETDAPLDEANIDRFNRLLRRLNQASQIIMVTHNKRTMQISGMLYGVTMETPGVSKLVSVNLAEAEVMTGEVN